MQLAAALFATMVAAAALAVVFSLFASSVVLTLRPEALAQRFLPPPESVPLWSACSARVAALEALGFRRLGVRVEWAGPLRVGKRVNCELASPDLRTFVTVGSARRVFRKVDYLYFLTAFEDGAVVFTAPDASYVSQVADDFVYGASAGPVPEVLAQHRARVALLAEKGRRVKADFGPEGRLDACRAFYAHPRVRARLRRAAWLVALQVAAVGAGTTLLMFSLFGR